MTHQHTIPIFFAADDGYVPYLAVAINSLLSNASPDYNYNIIVLSQDISEENCRRIRALAADHAD